MKKKQKEKKYILKAENIEILRKEIVGLRKISVKFLSNFCDIFFKQLCVFQLCIAFNEQ